jgi:hypothetical protein
MKKIIVLFLLLSTSLVIAQPKVYTEDEVEYKPYFPGGWDFYIRFIEKNLKWVNEKNSKNITVEFTVEPNGAITDINVSNPTGSANEKEALRVMASSPRWSPATYKGKAVPCRVIRSLYNPYSGDLEGGIGALTIEGVADTEAIPAPEGQEDNNIYNSAGIEVKPEFPGGIEKFYKFFNTNFKMPNEEDLMGKVFATFIVEKDGSLSEIKIIRDMGFGTGQEVLRVLKSSPKWIPGMQNGKKVRVMYTIPFAIDSSAKTTSLKK